MKSTQLFRAIVWFALTIQFAIIGRSQSFLTNGLVAYYPFNGNANDESGNADNGTVSGAVLGADRFGQLDRAYHFSVTNFGVITTSGSHVPSASSPRTISLWFKTDQYSAPEFRDFPLFSYGDFSAADPGKVFGLKLTSKPSTGVVSYEVIVTSDYQDYKSSQNFFDGRWHHALVSADSAGNVTTYVDAQKINFYSFPPLGTTIATTQSKFYIGYLHNVVGSGYFDGMIDDVRIFDRVLSDSEVSQLFYFESGPKVVLLKAVKPSFANLSIGTKYQLQTSTDSRAWTNFGLPFAATNTSMNFPQYWEVDVWNRLFFPGAGISLTRINQLIQDDPRTYMPLSASPYSWNQMP